MIATAIDLGSNSVKYTTARLIADGSLDEIESDLLFTRIGENLDETGELAEDAMARTLRALKRFATKASENGSEEIRCISTAGMRGAKNANYFAGQVLRETGIKIELIDGLREAELSFSAASRKYGKPNTPLGVFDLGGRSTEISLGSGRHIRQRASLEIGSVRLTERFLKHDPPRQEELSSLAAHVREVLQQNAPKTELAIDALIGVSGTTTSLLGVSLEIADRQILAALSEGKILTHKAATRVYDELKTVPTEQRVRGTVVPKGRADVVVAGALLSLLLMDHYQVEGVVTSRYGPRHGLLFEMLNPGSAQNPAR